VNRDCGGLRSSSLVVRPRRTALRRERLEMGGVMGLMEKAEMSGLEWVNEVGVEARGEVGCGVTAHSRQLG
jgi:hypothetical protein